jgi:hypothetical protein
MYVLHIHALVLFSRYLLSDVILYEELDIMPGLPKCDYIMLTNGDNLYSSSLVSATMEFMREQIDLIGYVAVPDLAFTTN